MVEGGTQTLNEFLSEGLYDEVRIEVSPVRLLQGIPAPVFPFEANISQEKI